jgi:hypothetical protein
VPDDLSAITPEAARREADTVQDADLPMLAALWLADGYDSAQLRDLAGRTGAGSRRPAAESVRLRVMTAVRTAHLRPVSESRAPYEMSRRLHPSRRLAASEIAMEQARTAVASQAANRSSKSERVSEAGEIAIVLDSRTADTELIPRAVSRQTHRPRGRRPTRCRHWPKIGRGSTSPTLPCVGTPQRRRSPQRTPTGTAPLGRQVWVLCPPAT